MLDALSFILCVIAIAAFADIVFMIYEKRKKDDETKEDLLVEQKLSRSDKYKRSKY
ncbi:hypothetical protein [Listeria booriae]|uniref:Uncharacterized protein n=1 Tax=Listeria booriae TaxID=1552123 RepID=A0A7X0YKS7_9LIST|nr:hypothetical protein [Listeria booriae]MBC1290587.1 hypothetical protein [Listeria booriae]MBC2115726.1 hypothetical protein [Listeria booriae]MBC2163467.1 hypothetical protein [Listeria booriae]